MMDTLARAVARRLNIIAETPGAFRELKGVEHLSKIVLVDQNPIGIDSGIESGDVHRHVR